MLIALTPHLSSRLQIHALAAANAITNLSCRASALTGMAPHLPVDLQANVFAEALATAETLAGDFGGRSSALADLAPHLPSHLLARAFTAATAHGAPDVQVLIAFAPRLPSDLRILALSQCLAATAADPFATSRAWALSALAPYLTSDLLGQALATASAISEDDSRARALIGLAPYLPPDLLARAVAAAPKDSIDTMTALLERRRTVLSSTETASLLGLLRASLGGDRRSHLRTITLAAREIVEIGGIDAVQECVKAITDVRRWWP